MWRRVAAMALGIVCVVMVQACYGKESEKKGGKNPVVVMKTSEGTIKIELWADKAPVTVKNFLRYVDEEFYDDTIFHRVISNFMIQGGGFTEDMKQKKTHDTIENEASGELKNKRGTVAMARTSDVHSATAQFFVNVVDNSFLDHRNKTPRGYGYCVFGKVVDGMDVVDKIRQVRTTVKRGMKDVPAEPVIIKRVRVDEDD